MFLNLLKLCVGCDSVEDLEEWIAFRLDERRRAGEPAEHWHTTRMVPTRGTAPLVKNLENLSQYPNLTAAMERRGWSEKRIEGVLGGNWLRYLAGIWRA